MIKVKCLLIILLIVGVSFSGFSLVPGSEEAEHASIAAELSGCSPEIVLALKEDPLISPDYPPFNRGALKALFEKLIIGTVLTQEEADIFSAEVTRVLRDRDSPQKLEAQMRAVSLQRKHPVYPHKSVSHEYVSLSHEDSRAASDPSAHPVGSASLYEYGHLAPSAAVPQQMSSPAVHQWIVAHSPRLNTALNELMEEIVTVSQSPAPEEDALSRLRFVLQSGQWPEKLTKEKQRRINEKVYQILNSLEDSGLPKTVKAAFRGWGLNIWPLEGRKSMTNVKNLGWGLCALLSEKMEDLILIDNVPDEKNRPIFLFLLHSKAPNVRSAADELIKAIMVKQVGEERASFHWRRENTFAEPWMKVRRELGNFLQTPQFQSLIAASQGKGLKRPALVFDYSHDIIDRIGVLLPDLIGALRNTKTSEGRKIQPTLQEAELRNSLENILDQINKIQEKRPPKRVQIMSKDLAYACVRVFSRLIEGVLLAPSDEFFARQGQFPLRHEEGESVA